LDNTIQKLVRRFKTNDPFIIASGLNIIVKYADLGEGTRGLYYKKLRRRFIVLQEGMDYHWQRLVLAHEIGHDRLHPGISRFWLDEQSFFNAGKYERQANAFAIKLLIHTSNIEQDESVFHFLLRCGIPCEMHQYYDE